MSQSSPSYCVRLLRSYVDSRELHRIEISYNQHLHHGHMLPAVQYDYGRCLVLSRFPADIIKGVFLMEQLKQLEYRPLDCNFMMAIGHTKLGNYCLAFRFTKLMLAKDPRNTKGRELQDLLRRMLMREYIFQMAFFGGVVVMMNLLISMVMSRR